MTKAQQQPQQTKPANEQTNNRQEQKRKKAQSVLLNSKKGHGRESHGGVKTRQFDCRRYKMNGESRADDD